MSERGVLRVEPRPYGRSREGRDLLLYGGSGAGGALFVGGIHGEEASTVTVLSRALRAVRPAALTCSVVLAANPDGLLAGTRGNAAGVDLNRNWPASNWRPGVVHHRWFGTGPREVALSAGSAPASEPEVAALVALVAEMRPELVIDVHTPLRAVVDLEELEIGRRLAEALDLRWATPASLSQPGIAATYFREIGVAYLNIELSGDALFDDTPSPTAIFSQLMTTSVDRWLTVL